MAKRLKRGWYAPGGKPKSKPRRRAEWALLVGPRANPKWRWYGSEAARNAALKRIEGSYVPSYERKE